MHQQNGGQETMTAKSEKHDCIYRQEYLEQNTYRCNRQGVCQINEDCDPTHYNIIQNKLTRETDIKIPATIITSPRKNPTINRTTKFLQAAGFTPIAVQDDSKNETPLGIYGNWLIGALKSYINNQSEWHLITQDDVFHSNDIITRLEPQLEKNTVFSLFAPQAMNSQAEPGWYSTKYYYTGPNSLLIHKTVLEILITSKIALQHCVSSKAMKTSYDDLGIFKQLETADKPVAFHNPNFSMHWAINSTHNKYQNPRQVLNKYAAGTYITDNSKYNIRTEINANTQITKDELISLYHEKGNAIYHFATGLKNGEFHHDPDAYVIIVKEDDGPISHKYITDRVFWTQ